MLSEIKSDSDQSISRAKPQLPPEQLEKLFSKVYQSGIANWSEQEIKEDKDLITEFGFLFALDDLDLCHRQYLNKPSN